MESFRHSGASKEIASFDDIMASRTAAASGPEAKSGRARAAAERAAIASRFRFSSIDERAWPFGGQYFMSLIFRLVDGSPARFAMGPGKVANLRRHDN